MWGENILSIFACAATSDVHVFRIWTKAWLNVKHASDCHCGPRMMDLKHKATETLHIT